MPNVQASSTDKIFMTPPVIIAMPKRVVDVWKFQATISDVSLLTIKERELANRFFRREDSMRFITGRAALRTLAAKYLGLAAEKIQIETDQNKKPFIIVPDTQLYFNISHSGRWLLIGFSSSHMGIDIEQVRNDFPYQDIMKEYFDADERAFIVNHESPQLAFYILWTRKEALMKAWGTGLQDNLIEISCLQDDHNPWRIESFRISGEYPAALVYTGERQAINFYDGSFLLP
jgi:4'-phosphopantetheinyl transferase